MVGILGGGLAGLTVAAHCKQECEVLEASDRVGGHCRSIQENGFTFDEGPHIIFSKNKKTLDYMLSLLGDNVHRGVRNNKIYYQGKYVKYPFENGIGELEPEEKYDCLIGYLGKSPKFHEFVPDYGPGCAYCGVPFEGHYSGHFEDWLYQNFGYGLTEKYLLPYNEKIWKCSAKEMAWDWAEERLPKASPEDIVKSACGVPTEGYTHQLNFYYPKTGGIESLAKAMADGVLVRLGRQVTQVARDVKDKWVVIADTRVHQYDKIVSTLPLPEMVNIFEGVPQDIKDAAKELRYNSLITVTFDLKTDFPWTALYVPSPEMLFHRLSFPGNFDGSGAQLIQAEITCNVGDVVWEMPYRDLVIKVREELEDFLGFRTGVYSRVTRIKYGYPVPTFRYRECRDKVKAYFESQGVLLCGRNAEFEYINMDQCIEHGMAVAEKLNG
jgi:protoporphyrinogen oxidase